MIDTTASKRRNNGVDLPEDFPQRLESFRDVSGLSWGELAACLGVDHERVMNWRRGVLPRDSALPNLMRLAQRVSGGMDALFPNVVETLGAEE